MSRDDAQDIAHDTVVVLHQKYGHLMECDLVPLAFDIAKRKRLERFRRAERFADPPVNFQPESTEASPEEELHRQQWLDWLRRTAPKLGVRCLQLFELRLKEWSTSQIAAQFSWTENNVLVSEKRCRDKARRYAGEARP